MYGKPMQLIIKG